MYRAFPVRIKGDGYTFWKDPLEVVLTALLVGMLFLSFFDPFIFAAAAVLLICWLGFEIFFALVFGLRAPGEVLFFACVMVLRSWARTAGFVKGIFIRK